MSETTVAVNNPILSLSSSIKTLVLVDFWGDLVPLRAVPILDELAGNIREK